ncbi:MAG: rhodanese-like domain-containing protein [Candidatus Kapaibacterium sp.]
MLSRLSISVLLTLSLASAKEGGDVTPQEVAKMLRKDRSVILLDVRTPEEYKQGHLKGCKLMNFYDADFRDRAKKLPKDKRIVLYCRSGRRSADAMSYLTSIGYSRVFNMLGGIIAWQKDRQPVVGP